MTPRAEAWLRQAHNDLEAARVTAHGGFDAQACYLAGQTAEKALFTAERVVEVAAAHLAG